MCSFIGSTDSIYIRSHNLQVVNLHPKLSRQLTRKPSWNQRWAHPGQQQGRRFPSLRLEQPHSIRRLLVSAFFADSIQHIHSLRASGVISSHVVNARGSDVSAFLRSLGTSCTTPPEIFFFDMGGPAIQHGPDDQVNSALAFPLRSTHWRLRLIS